MVARLPIDIPQTEHADEIKRALEAVEASSDPDAFVAALGELIHERLASNHWSNPSVEAFSRLLRDAATTRQMLFVIHDTRGLVGAISAFTEVLHMELGVVLKQLRGTPAMVRAIASIQREFRDMSHSVSDIMQVTYDAPGSRGRSMAPASFREAIERTMRLSRRSVKHNVQVDRPPDIYVRAPDADLVRVLHNLVANANDAINRTRRAGQIGIYSWASATTAFVEVWDNGPGMSEAEQEQIFDLFHTSKEEGGGGVGLAACKTLVERWGGTIEVESSAETGTTFRFSIPVL